MGKSVNIHGKIIKLAPSGKLGLDGVVRVLLPRYSRRDVFLTSGSISPGNDLMFQRQLKDLYRLLSKIVYLVHWFVIGVAECRKMSSHHSMRFID